MRALLIGLCATLLLSSPGTASAQTVFPGGDIGDLRALSPSLQFGDLVISGTLRLEPHDNPLLTVTSLVVAASGGISRTQDTCDFSGASNLTVDASASVTILGDISLTGRDGKRVTTTASCNLCRGAQGGTVRIDAAEIHIAGNVDVDGGAGSSFVDTFGSSGCNGGRGGRIELTAETSILDLSGASLEANGGPRGLGNLSNGAKGAVGAVELAAQGAAKMIGGGIVTDGELVLVAASSEIYAPFEYGTLAELVGGSVDFAPPSVRIVSPVDGGFVRLDRPFEVVIEVSDTVSGVAEVVVEGLGRSGPAVLGGIVGGVLRVTIPQPGAPSELTVAVTDNVGRVGVDSAAGLQLAGSLVVPAGQTFVLAEDLVVGADGEITIDGTVVVARGAGRTMTARSFTLGPAGRIEVEAVTAQNHADKVPSLTINVVESADFSGVLDLSGGDGLPVSNTIQMGEDGGDLTVFAASVSVGGALLSTGGDGVTRKTGIPVQTIGAGGGNGGQVRLFSRGDLDLSGGVDLSGGSSTNTGLGGCFDGGSGGALDLHHAGDADFTDAILLGNGGRLFAAGFGACSQAQLGRPAVAERRYEGSEDTPPLAPRVRIAEREPNEGRFSAQPLIYQTSLSIDGSIGIGDTSNGTVFGGGRAFERLDFYELDFRESAGLVLVLTSTGSASRLSLTVHDEDDEHLRGVVATQVGDTLALLFDNTGPVDELAAGRYFVVVGREQGASSASYELVLAVGDTLMPAPDAPPIALPEPGVAFGYAVTLGSVGMLAWRRRSIRR